MSRDIHRQAEKRLHAQADQAVEQFDSTLLHNRVHEQVAGQHSRAHPLAAWLDVTERAYDLAEREDIHDPAAEQAFSAGEVLTRGVGQLVADQVARACATIVLKAGDWTDTWSAGEIDAAQAEAERWLTEHRDAAERIGILEDVREAGESLDVVCGSCETRYQLRPTEGNDCPDCGVVDWEVSQ